MPIIQFSITGKAHAEKNLPCQDSCAKCFTANGWELMCIADGVSSSAHAEEGARIATESICRFWNNHAMIFTDEESILQALRTSFNYACAQIMQHKGNDPGYETTLHAAIIIADRGIFYGHVGDGGLFVRKQDGETRCLTEAMKDCDGTSVVPLSAGPKAWKFGSYRSSEITHAMLVTDGLFDVLQASLDKEYLLERLMMPHSSSAFRVRIQDEADRYYQRLLTGKGYKRKKRAFASVSDDITFSLWIQPTLFAAE